jgi:WhiB family transcriptional regulator, redox-sensing transcriptional regulator
METNIDELLDTKGVTVAYRYPTPRSTALSWNCAGYDALAKAQAVCAGCGVRTLCLALGISRDEWGVWGGVLLENGAPVQKVKRRGRPRKGAAA